DAEGIASVCLGQDMTNYQANSVLVTDLNVLDDAAINDLNVFQDANFLRIETDYLVVNGVEISNADSNAETACSGDGN
ncbi:unnamed protein product, partial [marine sediment metagenome]